MKERESLQRQKQCEMMTGKHETFMVVTSARHDSSLLVVVVVVVLVVHILSHFVGLARQITRAQMNERKTVQRGKEKNKCSKCKC